ncbi:MAG: hypothetical protein GC161_18360 [Planctomycetaceae bacterium]|nr:hypothetical protein [Planctomycetaceae bacterium]
MPDLIHIPRFASVTRQQARALTEEGQSERWAVFVGQGNSQMQGGGGTIAVPQQLPGEQDSGHPLIYTLSAEGNVIPGEMPFSGLEGSINIDPLMALGKQLVRYLGRNTKILLVQGGVGGTSFVGNNWNPGDDAYEAAIAQCEVALALPGAFMAGVFMAIGDLDDHTTFPTQLAAWIDGVRADLGSDEGGSLNELPIVLATCRNGENKAIINAAIRAMPRLRDYVAVAEGDGLQSGQEEEGNGDTVHFGPEARRIFGRRLARAWLLARTVSPQNRPFTDQDVSAVAGVIGGQAANAAVLAAHVGVGAGQHPAATTSVAGFLSAADKTKLDGVAAGAQVNLLEDLANIGGGTGLFSGITAKQGRFRTMGSLNSKGTVAGDLVEILPFPDLPQFDVRFYATGATGSPAEVAIENGASSGSIGTNLGVVGGNGDARGNALLFAANLGFLVNTYEIPAGSYSFAGWVFPGSFPASLARRHVCGSITTTAGNGWEVSLEKNNREVTVYQWDDVAKANVPAVNIVDQFWTLRASHLQDAGVVGSKRFGNNVWTHIAVVFAWDGVSAGRLYTYVNGVRDHYRAFPLPTSRSVFIGGFNSAWSMLGALDDLTFWSHALSPRQVERHMLNTQDKFNLFGGRL